MTTATPPQTFHIGDILSITTGCLVSPDHIGGVHRFLDYLTGDTLMTHQLPRAADEAAPVLRERFPDLAAIKAPNFDEVPLDEVEAAVLGWLDEMVTLHGETRDVAPLDAADHTSIDPLAELKMMRPDMPIIVVKGD